MVDFNKLFKEKKEESKILSPSQRKDRALSQGSEFHYVICPMCSMNRILNKSGIIASRKGKSGTASFSNYNFGIFIQSRRNAGGRGGGFYLDEGSSISWEDAKSMPEYQDLFEEIKNQCKRILEELK